MASGIDIDHALRAVSAALNQTQLGSFERSQAQDLVDQAVGTDPGLTVDEGGGLHAPEGERLGAIRRTPSGEWIVERQNPAAAGSEAPISPPEPPGRLRRLLQKLGPS